MLDDHPDDKDNELKFRCRDPKGTDALGRREEWPLDWEAVVLGHVVAQNKLVVSVDMNQSTGIPIIAVIVEYSRHLPLRQDSRFLETQTTQDFNEARHIGATHQEVEVIVPARRSIERNVALPMTVFYPLCS
jgi:hypothetical protein